MKHIKMTADQVLKKLQALGDPKNVEGMARFGISSEGTLGVSMPNIRKLGKQIGRDHALAETLWASGIHEARILACLVDDPKSVTPDQATEWIKDFDSWDVCDQCCMNLFDKLPGAFDLAKKWASHEREYEKRAGFALIASLAWHDKTATDDQFLAFLPIIKREATDERNYVKKAVNWALRHIGKRNLALNKAAIKTAKEIKQLDSKAARWIAADAIRELEGPAVQKRLKNS